MFVHLHVHTEYSLLESAARIKDLVSTAKEQGYTALAMTDTANMYAASVFYDECRAQGIKPIIGTELLVSDTAPQGNTRPETYSLVLLAKDAAGYRSLCRLSGCAVECPYEDVPVTPSECLSRYHEGLVLLSGYSRGDIGKCLLSGDIAGAKKRALFYKSIFGEDMYLEIQDHGTTSDLSLMNDFALLSRETGIALAASNDVHYVRREDVQIYRILRAIGENDRTDRINNEYTTGEHYLKAPEEITSLFGKYPQAVANTQIIADKCSFEMEYGNIKLPRYIPDKLLSEKFGDTNTEIFRNLCIAGLKKHYRNITKELTDRLDHEINTIVKMGYTDYYLIVWDFIHYAVKNGIPVGPGRGSGAGSLAAYCMGITNIDPIKYDLLFERFLNPERVSMPDFDIDLCYLRRQEVIDYVAGRYGQGHVAMITTFNTLSARAAVKDITRVLGYPVFLSKRINDNIPPAGKMTIDEAVSSSEELKKLIVEDSKAAAIINNAKLIEGMPRNASIHAAGVVISDKPVCEHAPVIVRDGVLTTQYTMNILERVGLLKMDFLALRNLTVISDCEREIRKKLPAFSVMQKAVEDGDKATYDMLSAGDTLGIFQLESAGMTELMKKMRPRSIEDLTAAISLYRPGPMESIPVYLANRKDPSRIRYKHPCLEPILKVTYGCVVYQEQVMQICRVMAGYSYGRADLVRRAMSKKKASLMEQERPAFIEGSVKNGIPKKTASEMFDELAGFASYAFNKSHAAAYSMVAYMTAYLKCHFFKEFMSAQMTSLSGDTGKISECIAECSARGVKILPPDVNESGWGFTPCEDGIRYSLLAAKGVGPAVISDIIGERERGGSFTGLSDIIRRCKTLTARVVQCLIKCGAMDCFGYNRRQMLEQCDKIAEAVNESIHSKIDGQMDFFGGSSTEETTSAEDELEQMDEYPKEKLLEMEKEILGIYISGDPLGDLTILSKALGFGDIRKAKGRRKGDKTGFAATVSKKKEHITKTGDTMAFITLADSNDAIDAVVFPEPYKTALSLCKEDKRVFIQGTVSTDRDNSKNIIAERILSDRELLSVCSGGTLYIRINSADKERIDRCVSILKAHSGRTRVLFVFTDKKIQVQNKTVPTAEISAKCLEQLFAAAGDENVRIAPKT
ncbi:MAG: DNA polymerase III subunit alpha [Oscillospiraceae bacterium]|nr:DNA polymerase III subunit alpha [Oscillospiraceae bacterium]